MNRTSLAEARRANGTIGEIVAEVERILLESRNFLSAEGHLFRAIARATIASDRRYIDRGTGEGPEPLAQLIATWLVRRADGQTAAASLRAAIAAVQGDEDERQLSMDLAAFVSDYLDGTMSNTRFGYLLDNPNDAVRHTKPAKS